jgi:hypothetical protein
MGQHALAQGKHSAPRSSSAWCAYFRANAEALFDIPWQQGVQLTAAERAAITESVRGFQLGESSEGRHLLRGAQDYAARSGDADYVDAIKLFIREEQRHARDLGRFLTAAGIPLLDHTWPDTVFRWLRHRAGLELSIVVLITAEIIAEVYYPALRAATGSAVLRRLCDQIISDEVEHVRFQAERLAILRQGRAGWRVRLAHGLQRFLLGGTCLVVWWKHAPALKAGGFGFRRFWRESWRKLNAALAQADPRRDPFARVENREPVSVG